MHRGIKTVESGFVWFHRLFDLIIPIIILFLLSNTYSLPWTDRYIIIGTLGGLFFILSAQATGTYTNWRGRTYFSSIKLILNSWVITWTALIIIAFLYKDTQNFSRVVITLWALITPLFLISYRLLVRMILAKYRKETGSYRNIAIAGAGKVGQHIANTIQSNKWLGYHVIAYFDDNPKLINTEIYGIPVLGNLDTITEESNRTLFDELYICLPLRAELKIKILLNTLTDSTAIVKFIPDLFSFDLMHAKWSEINGIPVISVFDTPLSSKTAQFIKRVEDIILSTLIMLIISPIMIAVSIGIKLSSPGPVFYTQSRIGWNGQKFNILKFRSMPTDIEKDVIKWGAAGNKINTRFGQFIRKYNLDELPQFINVLKGDMSIVGPRPERDIFVEKFRKEIPRYMQKHMVKAGITGWAQINGWRGDTSLEKRIEFDLDYINRWGLWLDIKIIILTITKSIHTGA